MAPKNAADDQRQRQLVRDNFLMTNNASGANGLSNGGFPIGPSGTVMGAAATLETSNSLGAYQKKPNQLHNSVTVNANPSASAIQNLGGQN